MPTDAFDRVTFRGRLMDKKTEAFLRAMEARLGYELTVVQGSYTNSVGASAGTHSGGGVVDLAAWDHERKVQVAKRLGAFVWYRPAIPGVWGSHIHLGIRDHGNLSPEAKRQQDDYDAHPPRNGISGHAEDRTWHPSPPVTFAYPVPTPEPPAPQANNVTHARDALVELITAADKAAAMLARVPENRKIARGELDDVQQVKAEAEAILGRLPRR